MYPDYKYGCENVKRKLTCYLTHKLTILLARSTQLQKNIMQILVFAFMQRFTYEFCGKYGKSLKTIIRLTFCICINGRWVRITSLCKYFVKFSAVDVCVYTKVCMVFVCVSVSYIFLMHTFIIKINVALFPFNE